MDLVVNRPFKCAYKKAFRNYCCGYVKDEISKGTPAEQIRLDFGLKSIKEKISGMEEVVVENFN
jgi:hypothetical protein